MNACLAPVDWQPPWLAPYRARGEAAQAAVTARGSVAAALNAVSGGRPQFVRADALPAGEPYERFVHASGSVPTLDDLHDLFNGLVWLAFPLAKRRLNELQAREIACTGIGAARGPLRDAVTLLDENGALLQAPDALWQALVARDWRRLFVELRPAWSNTRLTLFGHALLEKLCRPRKSITAHVLRMPVAPAAIDELDAALAETLQPDSLMHKPFEPLPILGVPGWWPENANAAFYDDAAVFRPRRPQPAQPQPA